MLINVNYYASKSNYGRNFTRTTGDVDNTELWNGSIWVEQNDLNTGRSEFAGAGTTTAGLAFGGQTGSPNVRTAGTEEWDVPFESTKTVGTD